MGFFLILLALALALAGVSYWLGTIDGEARSRMRKNEKHLQELIDSYNRGFSDGEIGLKNDPVKMKEYITVLNGSDDRESHTADLYLAPPSMDDIDAINKRFDGIKPDFTGVQNNDGVQVVATFGEGSKAQDKAFANEIVERLVPRYPTPPGTDLSPILKDRLLNKPVAPVGFGTPIPKTRKKAAVVKKSKKKGKAR